MAFLDETGLTYLWKKIKLAPYPVGSIYMSVDSTSPASLFGGTWEQLKDRFMLAAGDTYAAGSTGGEAQHKLTENEMPRHNHIYNRQRWFSNDQGKSPTPDVIFSWDANGTDLSTSYSYHGAVDFTGGNQSHNNMPPYLAVYVWKRVA